MVPQFVGGRGRPAVGLRAPQVNRARKRSAVLCPCSCLDRKSTRLNSSHSQISYAVFCLKKKIAGRDATVPRADDGDGRDQQDGDRKSTRLNSSHSQISHAVFCLKKKTTTTTRSCTTT